MNIKDRDLREALEILSEECENYEATIKGRDERIEELENDNIALADEIDRLETTIEELETAVAEAYLTSDVGEQYNV